MQNTCYASYTVEHKILCELVAWKRLPKPNIKTFLQQTPTPEHYFLHMSISWQEI
jgi:hypothetical protein